MYLNIYLLTTQLFIASNLLKPSQCYVLLAANLEDFKTIARKFIPERLVNQLAGLASKPGYDNVYPKFKRGIEVQSERESGDDDPIPVGPEKDELRTSRVNFEQLVQKVKERLQKDLQLISPNSPKKVERLSAAETKPEHDEISTKQIRKKPKARPRKVVSKKPKPQVTIKEDSDQDSNYDSPNADVYKLVQDVKPKKKPDIPKVDDGMPFARIDMLAKDSYEDYVTPVKEDNIFEEPDDLRHLRIKNDHPKIVKQTRNTESTKKQVDTTEEDEDLPLEDVRNYQEYVGNREEVKAKTKDLWYDYNSTVNADDYDNTTPMDKNLVTKRKQGTGFPKRDYYKMSSPNYAAKIPVVAEKYNFDEPIPEKDREPENLTRLLPMPPSVINGKVKFSK